MATFDTLAAVRRMTATGIEREHAEAIAQTASEAATAGQEQLATKADLAGLKADMTWRMVILAGVIVAAIKLIPA